MLDLSSLGQTAKAPASAFIRETDAARFEEDVLTVSLKTPVIVDFWAPWCGPCKQMMPALEKVVSEAQGQVHLVKVNVDKNPELAEVFRVQSVPTIYAFFQGQPVDGFMGGRGEPELRTFVAKLSKLSGAKPEAPEAVNAESIAKLMAEGDKHFMEGNNAEAMTAYSAVLEAAPDNADALGGIGWCLVAEKDMESVAEILSQATPEQKAAPRLKGLQALADMGREAADWDSAEVLSARAAQNPKDLTALYGLALHAIARGNLQEAVDHLVTLTRRDREWQDQKARRLLLGLFDAMGPSHPLTGPGRRKLSTVLFS